MNILILFDDGHFEEGVVTHREAHGGSVTIDFKTQSGVYQYIRSYLYPQIYREFRINTVKSDVLPVYVETKKVVDMCLYIGNRRFYAEKVLKNRKDLGEN